MKTIGKSRAPVLASQVNFGGKFADSKLFDDKGELNASSTKDAIAMLCQILASGNGMQHLHTENTLEAMEAAAVERAGRMEAVAAAIADTSGITAAELGQELAAVIYQNAVHQGFARAFMQYIDVAQGELPRAEMDRRDVTAAILTGPTQAQLQIVRDYWIILPEVDITVRLEIEGKRLNQSKEDLLQLKFNQGLEAILIAEDRMFKAGVDAIIDSDGSMASIAVGSITPSILKAAFVGLSGFGMRPANMLVSAAIMGDVMLDTSFGILLDPITRLEILKTGLMGNIFGTRIYTDATRDPRQKVLAPNEIYVFADPRYVGAYSDRGGVQSKPLSAAETAINGLGWHMVEYFSVGVYGERGAFRIRLT
jgi:hypothetical protein